VVKTGLLSGKDSVQSFQLHKRHMASSTVYKKQ